MSTINRAHPITASTGGFASTPLTLKPTVGRTLPMFDEHGEFIQRRICYDHQVELSG